MKRRPVAPTRRAAQPSQLPPEAERVAAVVPGSTPADRAWARVALECPVGRGAADHRSGALVHIVPFGYGSDVRCVEGEPVHGYPGFFRPRGGYVDLVPTGVEPPRANDGTVGAVPAVYARKSLPYSMAEMAGR